MTRLPAFIEKDFDKKVSQVEGVINIIAKDVFGNRVVAVQDFMIFMSYTEKLSFHVSFGESYLIEDLN